MFKKILLEAGHWLSEKGEPDNGASYDGLVERELVISITRSLRSLLMANDRPLIDDYGIEGSWSLDAKVAAINDFNRGNDNTDKDTLLISVHINAGGWTGLETFTYKKWEKGLEYGQTIIDNIIELTGQNDRGAKYEDQGRYSKLAIVHYTIWCTTILVECGFIDTTADRVVLINDLDKIVIGLYNGIADLCGFEHLEITEEDECGTRIKELEDREQELIAENQILVNTNNLLEGKIEAAQKALA